MTSLMRTSLPSRIQAYPSLRAEGVAIHGCNCHVKVLRVGFMDCHGFASRDDAEASLSVIAS